MIKPGDYVEGYEHYGNKVRRMRGWVDRVHTDGSVDIRCDDAFDGARGNMLDSELGEIRVIEEEPGWYFKSKDGKLERFDVDHSAPAKTFAEIFEDLCSIAQQYTTINGMQIKTSSGESITGVSVINGELVLYTSRTYLTTDNSKKDSY